ncbi:MAG: DNA glycosylase [Clostridia bacterium]|nr:DNA glycosylase [Clostridia bacterium]
MTMPQNTLLSYKLNLNDIPYFDLYDTLNCGQCFRFEEVSTNNFIIIAKDKPLHITLEDNFIIFNNTSKDEFESVWLDYFDLNTDYCEIMQYLFSKDQKFKSIAQKSNGIRILKQDPWETLCSFIISQNNNIPRIKGIINRLCENFGNKIPGSEFYSFPSPETLAALTCEDLSIIRSGFRAKYIIDAALKIASNKVCLDSIYSLPLDEAAKYLMTIKGVGVKVAACTLLYGFHRLDSFPQDVWIKRAMDLLYNGADYKIFGKYAGVAQQYIFNYVRNIL